MNNTAKLGWRFVVVKTLSVADNNKVIEFKPKEIITLVSLDKGGFITIKGNGGKQATLYASSVFDKCRNAD